MNVVLNILIGSEMQMMSIPSASLLPNPCYKQLLFLTLTTSIKNICGVTP